MGIDEFDPISQPKVIKSAKKIKELPEDKQIIIEAYDTVRDREQDGK